MGLGLDPKSAWPKSPGIFLSRSCSFLSLPAPWGPIHFLLVTICSPGYSLLDKCSLPMPLAHYFSYAESQPTITLSCRGKADKLKPWDRVLKGTYSPRRENCTWSGILWAKGHETSPMMFPSPNLASLISGPPLPAAASNFGHSHTSFSIKKESYIHQNYSLKIKEKLRYFQKNKNWGNMVLAVLPRK